MVKGLMSESRDRASGHDVMSGVVTPLCDSYPFFLMLIVSCHWSLADPIRSEPSSLIDRGCCSKAFLYNSMGRM